MGAIPADFNFIATTYKGLEREAAAECRDLFRKLGDASPEPAVTDVMGLLVGKTSLNPVDVARELRGMVEEEPWSVRLVLRFVPVEGVTYATPSSVKAKVAELCGKISAGESFRVTVEKRHNEAPSKDFVEAAASAIKQRVDLDHPDWIVLAEIVGNLAGVSVVKPDSIFSSSKAKRGL
jgi:tRNA acetyltransferase TAN1